jgi:hypothetical protein
LSDEAANVTDGAKPYCAGASEHPHSHGDGAAFPRSIRTTNRGNGDRLHSA